MTTTQSRLAIVALQQDPDPFRMVQEVLQSPLLKMALLAGLALVVCLWLALVARAYTDAARRETTPAFWALLCFVLPFLGYLVYAVVRPPEYAEDREERELRLSALRREARGEGLSAASRGEESYYPCPSCEEAVAEDFLACPSCGEHLKEACGRCARPLEPEWMLCPYCPDGRPVGLSSAPPRGEGTRSQTPPPVAEARDDGERDRGSAPTEIRAVRPNGSSNGRARLRDARPT